MGCPGGPVVKTWLSNAQGMGLIPGWGGKDHTCPQGQKSKQKTEAIL